MAKESEHLGPGLFDGKMIMAVDFLKLIQPLILEGRFASLGTRKFEGEGSRNPRKKKCQNTLGERCWVMAMGYIDGGSRRKGG
jgi:hypothetical protein